MISKFKEDAADGTKSTGEEMYMVCYIIKPILSEKEKFVEKKIIEMTGNVRCGIPVV